MTATETQKRADWVTAIWTLLMDELVEKLLKEVGIGGGGGTATFAARIEISKDSDVAHHDASIEVMHAVENALRLRITATNLFHDAVNRAILAIVGHHHVLKETFGYPKQK